MLSNHRRVDCFRSTQLGLRDVCSEGGDRAIMGVGFLRVEREGGRYHRVNEGELSRLRTALCNIKLSRQNKLGESHSETLVRRKALRELNALRALPVYPVFENEKSNGSNKKSVKQKIAY